MGFFKTPRSDQDGSQASAQQDSDKQVSTAAKVTIVDADGECFVVIDKAGIATRLSNSMAFRRACAAERVATLLLREKTEIDSKHILAELISWSQACLHSATKSKEWESTLAWSTISSLRVFETESFSAFLCFKPLAQSYSVYSLDHFIVGGVTTRDPLALQTALRGFETTLEFVFGDAFHGACEPTIRSLSRGELRAMDGEFLRYSIEMAIRGWCRWMRLPTSILSGGVATVTRQEICVEKLKECLSKMPVTTEDLEAFRSSGFSALARWENASMNKRTFGDQSDRLTKRAKTDVETSPGSADKAASEKAICLYQLAYLVKRSGETTRACKFVKGCRAVHLVSLDGANRGTLVNAINSSTLWSAAAKKELIERVKEKVAVK